MNTHNFWEAIDIDQRGDAYRDLANLYQELGGGKLPEPEGLRGDSKPLPPIINAPDYLEMEEIRMEAEVRQPPRHQKRVL